jgi:predicted DCC family thiol-disulfide oxidoreductase YuxK
MRLKKQACPRAQATPPGPQPPTRLRVLYDDECGFCKWSLDKILAWDRHRRLRPVAIQSEEGQRLLADVPPGERLDSWHLVLPDGELRSAGAAAAPLAEALPGGRPLAFLLRTFPRLTERAYRAVAANRGRFARALGVGRDYRPRR